MGVLALIVGGLLVFAAFAFDTSSGGVHNFGRLQQQMMMLHSGLALLIISAIRWNADKVVSQPNTIQHTSNNRTTFAEPDTTDDSKFEYPELTTEPYQHNSTKSRAIGGLIVLGVILGLALFMSLVQK